MVDNDNRIIEKAFKLLYDFIYSILFQNLPFTCIGKKIYYSLLVSGDQCTPVWKQNTPVYKKSKLMC